LSPFTNPKLVAKRI